MILSLLRPMKSSWKHCLGFEVGRAAESPLFEVVAWGSVGRVATDSIHRWMFY